MPKLPIGDIGPCEVTWDFEGDNPLIITPYLGKVSLRMADAVTDVHIDGQGVAPIESFFEGATVEFEVPMARSTLAQLAETIGYGSLGTLVGNILTLHNVAGLEMYANAKQIVIKPLCNDTPNLDPRTWTLLYMCHPYRDFELGWDRSGQRVHMVKFKVFPNQESGYEGEYYQEGFLCPPETPLMTRRYLDPAWLVEYKALCVFEDKLCIWDHGPNNGDGRVLYTEDGATWSTLFSRTAAQIGATSDLSGNAMVVYNGHLFITLYRSDESGTYPRVIEWDGTNVIQHLKSPAGNNYMGSGLVVWDGKLWCLTDVTPGVGNSRRVVYYYNGTAWTAIILYDGAAFLDYNKAAQLPINDLRPRCTRLFVFNDELYLVATRYTGTKWAWEVWKFDAVAYDNFTQIYDSDAFDDGYALAAIIEFEGNVKIVGNEIVVASGNPGVRGKLYTSPDMVNWAEESDFAILKDEFDDVTRDPLWTDEPNNGTIVESGDLLTLAVANGVDGDWWIGVKNAPFSWITPTIKRIEVITKLNSYTVNDETSTGLMIGSTTTIPDNAGGYCFAFARLRNDGAGINGLVVEDIGKDLSAYVAVTTLPIWLRMVIGGSGAGMAINFDYSTDGINWITLYTKTGLTWTFIGLHAKNWAALNAISAPFEFFHVYESIGFPFGEELFRPASGECLIPSLPLRFYLNCVNVDPGDNKTCIRYWDEDLGQFTLDQEIATNLLTAGGGLKTFRAHQILGNALYAGKYKEVYANVV